MRKKINSTMLCVAIIASMTMLVSGCSKRAGESKVKDNAGKIVADYVYKSLGEMTDENPKNAEDLEWIFQQIFRL